MSNLAERLEGALSGLGLVGAVIFRDNGEELCRTGDLTNLSRGGLFRVLFGSPDEIRRLSGALNGQILPQIWSQGGIDCFVSKTPAGFVFGAFAENPPDAYHLSKSVARRVEEILLREFPT